jgi:hypothetical protein
MGPRAGAVRGVTYTAQFDQKNQRWWIVAPGGWKVCFAIELAIAMATASLLTEFRK